MSDSPLPGDVAEALHAAADWLEAFPCRYVVIGGLASALLARPRLTQDVDLTIVLNEDRLEELVAAGANFGLSPRKPDWLDFARTTRVILLVHEPTGVQIDCGMAAQEFDLNVIDQARWLEVGGRRIPVARPDDLLVMKSVARRDRDVVHVEDLLEVMGDQVNLDEVRGWLAMAADGYEDPGIVESFEAALRRARDRRASDPKPGAS